MPCATQIHFLHTNLRSSSFRTLEQFLQDTGVPFFLGKLIKRKVSKMNYKPPAAAVGLEAATSSHPLPPHCQLAPLKV